MEKIIRELEQIARELRTKDEELSVEVREAGRQTQEGFERVVRAIHKLHNFVVIVPEKLTKLAQNLKENKA